MGIQSSVSSITFSDYDVAWSPYKNRDFGFMDFNCKMEALFNFSLFFMVLLWNFAWTYDIYLTCSFPLMFTEKYVFYYKVAVYFFSIIFCIIVYFPTME